MLARCRPISSARGFTLIELISCIVIAGILAAMASQSFIGQQTFQERGYIDEIAAALRHSQRVAVATGCEVTFTVDNAGYRAFQRALSAGVCSGAYSVTVKRLDGTALNASRPTEVTSTPNIQVTFDRDGRVTAGAPAPLQVGPFTLTVSGISGFVQVQ